MGLLALASRLGTAEDGDERPKPIEIAEVLIAGLRSSGRHADYPGEVFQAFKTLIGFRKGALLLRSEHDDVYEPWITEGFNRTTARRLRIPANFPVLVGDGDSRFVEIDPADLAPVLSNSEFGPLFGPRLLIVGPKKNPAALILMADLPSGQSFISEELRRGIQRMNDELSPGILESRALMRVADDEANMTWNEWLENWDRDEAILVVVDATNAIDAVVDAVPGLELYRARKDVVAIIRHITGRMGRLFDLKDGRFVVLFPPERVPDRDLFFRQLSSGFSEAYETLKVRPEFPAHFLHWPTDREALSETSGLCLGGLAVNLAVELAKSGKLSARSGSIRIHSAYDPEREASRFVDGQNLELRRGATVIVVGAGLGYLDRELKRRRPDLTILAFHLLPKLCPGTDDSDPGVRRWNPSDRIDAADFIFSNLGELDVPGLRILEWRPSILAAPEAATAVKAALAAVVRRYSGNITTTAAFGRRWIQNTLRNFAETDCLIGLGSPPATTVVAASGPSLEGALEALGRSRRRFVLWALPSALPALTSAGIRPDLIFASDPGFWARIHWRHFPRGVPVAMPLSAAPHPESPAETFLLIHGTPEEKDLLAGDDWRGLQVPQAGSVAIAAVETWKRISSGLLILAGLDLSWFDLRGHARPHAFEGWLGSFDNRFKPPVAAAWERASLIAPKRVGVFRTGPSLQTYTDWFRTAGLPQSVYRFRRRDDLPSPIALPAVGELGEEALDSLPVEAAPSYGKYPAPLSREKRINRIRSVLNGWISTIDSCADTTDLMNSSLAYTLDPGGVLALRRLGESAGDSDRDEVCGRVSGIIRDLAEAYG